MAGPLVGILLAAGSGSRFGSDKLLHPLADGRPLALAAAESLRDACDRTLAVLRPGNDRLAALLAEAGHAVLFAADADQGMGHSLAAGVRATPEAAGWLVALGDMPAVAPGTCRLVADAVRAGTSVAAPLHGGRRGHPVGFARHWYDDLAGLTGDAGARALLQRPGTEIRLLPTDDPGCLRDVDRPEDLLPLLQA